MSTRLQTLWPLPVLLALVCAAVIATPRAAADVNDVLPEAPAKELIVRACISCHVAPFIVARKRTAEEWDEVIAVMVDRGAPLTDEEQEQVYAYLVKNFGPDQPVAPAPSTP